ncbi:MAG: nucleotidyl transferase AbiEii/AbiGii toxin family protein [Gammaproteobacteria bacterium]|nr:nucleotidyl transferase AbiEii/AbiGii toxin family protein [Gammaproteobacteria bacterium]MCY3987926.1 nucleotidyl transferase AbiEii/AbiGii toxin family protein [Gammaproteobacteria bacterium]
MLHWDILPKAQGTLWGQFVSLPEHFVLYGGTALALQLGHRSSVDFDFFSAKPIEPRQLYETLDFLAKGRITQEERNTLTVQARTEDGPVAVSFFGGLGLRCVDLPAKVPPGVRLAGVRDIFGCKCAAIQQRESLKDLQDISALLRHGHSLAEGLGCSRAIYGGSFNPRITLMALSYPPALEGLPAEDRQLLTQAVEAIQNVPPVAVEPLGRIGEVEPVQSKGQTMDASSNPVAKLKQE